MEVFTLLGIILAFAMISYTLIHLTKHLFIRCISKSRTVRKSIRLRLAYYIIRLILKFIIFIASSILFIGFFVIIINTQHNTYKGFYLILGILCLFIYLWSTLSLPVSMMSISKFKKKFQNKNYILYLRGFMTDDYNPHTEEIADNLNNLRHYNFSGKDAKDKIDSNLTNLNERNLVRAWKHWYKVISVGSPNELESPEGSARVYLENSCWQDDVLFLMQNAKYIIINAHHNDNCIWEIIQADSSFSEKTIYYIDNVVNLKMIYDKMQETIPKSLKYCYYENLDIVKGLEGQNNGIDKEEMFLEQKKKFCHLLAFQKDDEIYIQPYKNDFTGFMQTAQIVVRQI